MLGEPFIMMEEYPHIHTNTLFNKTLPYMQTKLNILGLTLRISEHLERSMLGL